ncbi:wsv146 [White spot syndrome virus]|uniref:Wsv146 n=4 Tax=White spot syndrome virus TaxID=342409 RepID=Q8VB50_WSSVS|nr:wsv146 [Shrimp white spot syndrome virus]AFX59522.1 wsv146 [White spot syndrome virus]AAL33150.1 wsv146 [Shrimp white spot syndrome virus]AAL89069.1 WSSV201 [Shrimp white spot syndrome virus]AWQ60330.1 wsv146 [Shrimp white spot syndrome virus]AWQ60745.1 wsv146 [Shrimp white spot syndrome virus]
MEESKGSGGIKSPEAGAFTSIEKSVKSSNTLSLLYCWAHPSTTVPRPSAGNFIEAPHKRSSFFNLI